jgi:hypothetical protein
MPFAFCLVPSGCGLFQQPVIDYDDKSERLLLPERPVHLTGRPQCSVDLTNRSGLFAAVPALPGFDDASQSSAPPSLTNARP